MLWIMGLAWLGNGEFHEGGLNGAKTHENLSP